MICKTDCEWQQEVRRRDKVCRLCGYGGEALTGHHILGKKAHPKIRLDTRNGILLCSGLPTSGRGTSCHDIVHRQNEKENLFMILIVSGVFENLEALEKWRYNS